MPSIAISIAKGRTPQQIRNLIDAVHKAAVDTVDAVDENVVIVVQEIEHEHYSRGNLTIKESRAGLGNTAESANQN